MTPCYVPSNCINIMLRIYCVINCNSNLLYSDKPEIMNLTLSRQVNDLLEIIETRVVDLLVNSPK